MLIWHGKDAMTVSDETATHFGLFPGEKVSESKLYEIIKFAAEKGIEACEKEIAEREAED